MVDRSSSFGNFMAMMDDEEQDEREESTKDEIDSLKEDLATAHYYLKIMGHAYETDNRPPCSALAYVDRLRGIKGP